METNKLIEQTQALMTPLLESVAKEQAAEMAFIPGQLRTQQELVSSKKAELMSMFTNKDFMKRSGEGMVILFDSLPEFLSEEEVKTIKEEMSAGIAKCQEELAPFQQVDFSNLDTMPPLPKEPIGDLFELSEESYKHFYTAAHRKFEAGLHEDAFKIFATLTFFQPLVADYWLGYGIAAHELELYEEALAMYAVAGTFTTDDPRPHLFAVECYIALKQWDDADAELLVVDWILDQGIDESETWKVERDRTQEKIRIERQKAGGRR